MGTQGRYIFLRRHGRLRGFTLIEMLAIVAIVGILALIAAPSFASMMDGIKVNQTVASLQSALQDTQRQAIRKSQICTVQVSSENLNGQNKGSSWPFGSSPTNTPKVSGNCLSLGSPNLSPDVLLATNMQLFVATGTQPNATAPPNLAINYRPLGSAEFSILSSVQLPQRPSDPTGKIVTSIANPSIPMKCIAISSTLGLTRVGTYTGSTNPTDITDTGVCTALDWTRQ